MKFKTIAILLSFGAACSSAAYGMDEAERDLQNRRAQTSEKIQTILDRREERNAALDYCHKEITGANNPLNDAMALWDAVKNGTMSIEDATIAKEIMFQNHDDHMTHLRHVGNYAVGENPTSPNNTLNVQRSLTLGQGPLTLGQGPLTNGPSFFNGPRFF